MNLAILWVGLATGISTFTGGMLAFALKRWIRVILGVSVGAIIGVAVLTQVYHDLNMADALARMPAVSLFLEIGASERTMISLMSLGLSRVAAMRLTTVAPSRNLDVGGRLDWLRGENLGKAQLSPLLLDEVRLLLEGLGNVIPLR